MMDSHNARRVVASIATMLLIGLAVAAAWLVMRPSRKPEVSADELPQFVERAAQAGLIFQMNFLPEEQGENFKINLYDHGAGLAVGDFNGDGFDDIYFCNQLGTNALYRNKGDGTFEDVAPEAGVALGDRVSVAATFIDYDNDGRQDLFVTSTRGGNVMFRNVGNAKFEDVTAKIGLSHVGHSQTATFFDYDGDGHLDLFLTNTASWTTETYDKSAYYYRGKGNNFGGVMLSSKEFNILYRNNGNGTFTDVTDKAGLRGRGWAGDAIAFDYDEDGRPDLFVTCMFGRAQLYRNNPDGTFSDVTLKVLGRTPWGGTGARAFDAHNQGRLDLYVVDMHSDMWMGLDLKHESFAASVLSKDKKFNTSYGPRVEKDPSLIEREKELALEIGFSHEEVIFGNGFYRNMGRGRFEETSENSGLENFWPWGIAAGDFDNDGWEDVYVPAGMGFPFYYWPNQLLINNRDGTFSDRGEECGSEPSRLPLYLPNKIRGKQAARSSRAAAVADFDNDGRLEIVTNNFNDQPYYFKNNLPKCHFVEFRLQGTKSNRDAIGAVIRLYRGNEVMTRQLGASCGYLSQSSKTIHFGLGNQPKFDRVEITWPSGIRQQLAAPTIDSRHDIVEPTQ